MKTYLKLKLITMTKNDSICYLNVLPPYRVDNVGSGGTETDIVLSDIARFCLEDVIWDGNFKPIIGDCINRVFYTEKLQRAMLKRETLLWSSRGFGMEIFLHDYWGDRTSFTKKEITRTRSDTRGSDAHIISTRTRDAVVGSWDYTNTAMSTATTARTSALGRAWDGGIASALRSMSVTTTSHSRYE